MSQLAVKMNQMRLKGYVHHVSPAKKSRVKSFPYFNFSLQVDGTTKRHAVCYDMSKQKILKGYEQSREPVALLNIAEKQSLRNSSEDDLILNKKRPRGIGPRCFSPPPRGQNMLRSLNIRAQGV